MALTLRVVNVNSIGFESCSRCSTFISPNPSNSRFVSAGCSKVEQISIVTEESENSLIQALVGIQGRGRSSSPQQLNAIERAIQVLEHIGGVSDPTNSSLIEGRWQLIFTTRPGTASPIQAAASIGDGKRILFRFDRAAFSFKFLPFKVPYPVPFKLLGDEAKGWLDTTYLSHSGNLRISRGNKGTTFVLQKQTEPRQKLLTAISSGVGVREAIDKLISLNKNSGEEDPELEEGEWQMIWNSQTVTDSWLENAANGLMGKQIVEKNGRIKYVVNILLGLKFSMSGIFVKSSPKVYEVTMDDAAIIGGPFGYPLEFGKKFILEILFNDGKVRISRGDNEIIFVHARTNAQ
ncbi:putative plastid lipid-associated protein/fibrillin [Medicago truncatula]|uniref:Plastid lipid-associated protein n=1 Tax=Medicago truncatula TaxID=3880 RepID=A0A072W2R6_MEDTR|nr:probable plastid-lipid-associated protein 12, chloroplastic isoform X2 [Medicago truncatula]KEH44540.1 plastid lipid-associated protein [Medicago truncatula]RHN82776.1 putative plastid lipid-associated protein/fibrillin [Medicago truncatula]